MPPFSSGFGASLGAGVVQGAVESEEKARKESSDREVKALNTYTQLVGQGWMPMDKEKGSPSGEALFFPSLGQMLVPPVVDKTTEHLMKLDRLRIERERDLIGYATAARNAENATQAHGYKIEGLEKDLLLKDKALQLKDKEIQRAAQEAKTTGIVLLMDNYGGTHQWNKNQGTLDGKPFDGRLDQYVPPGKAVPGLSEKVEMWDMTTPPGPNGKSMHIKKWPGEAQEMLKFGKAILGKPLTETAEKPDVNVLEVMDKYLMRNKEGAYTTNVLAPNQEPMMQHDVEKTGRYKLHKFQIPEVNNVIFPDRPLRNVYLPVPVGQNPKKSQIMLTLINDYKVDQKDAENAAKNAQMVPIGQLKLGE